MIIYAKELRNIMGISGKCVEWSCFTNACHSDEDLGAAAPTLPLFSNVCKANCIFGHLFWAGLMKHHSHVPSLS